VQVYVGDTMGELLQMYAAADVAFVGGSLVATGGHNLLEPAALGLVPVSGPHLFNFQQVAELLTAADALELVNGPESLADCVARLLADAPLRQEAGERARQVVEANRGALARTLDLIAAYGLGEGRRR
jgi:3-deoxy-D-manno-octulosonic-acid transferase